MTGLSSSFVVVPGSAPTPSGYAGAAAEAAMNLMRPPPPPAGSARPIDAEPIDWPLSRWFPPRPLDNEIVAVLEGWGVFNTPEMPTPVQFFLKRVGIPMVQAALQPITIDRFWQRHDEMLQRLTAKLEMLELLRGSDAHAIEGLRTIGKLHPALQHDEVRWVRDRLSRATSRIGWSPFQRLVWRIALGPLSRAIVAQLHAPHHVAPSGAPRAAPHPVLPAARKELVSELVVRLFHGVLPDGSGIIAQFRAWIDFDPLYAKYFDGEGNFQPSRSEPSEGDPLMAAPAQAVRARDFVDGLNEKLAAYPRALQAHLGYVVLDYLLSLLEPEDPA